MRGHKCHCETCPEYCMGDCVCGDNCECSLNVDERRFARAQILREYEVEAEK